MKIITTAAAALLVGAPVAAGSTDWPSLPNLSPHRLKPLPTTREQKLRNEVLRRRQTELKHYRKADGCWFDWRTWRKSSNGIRSIKVVYKSWLPGGDCWNIKEVAVDCKNHKISEFKGRKWVRPGWSDWELVPDEYLNFYTEVCANALGVVIPDNVPPKTKPETKRPAKHPGCTGPTILCGMP